MNLKHKIGQIVAKEFDMPDEFWKTKSNKRIYTYPKKALVYAIRETTYSSLLDIARFMDYKEHSAILYHITDCQNMMEQYEDYKMKVCRVISKTKELIKKEIEKTEV